jgi:hypothetical protein
MSKLNCYWCNRSITREDVIRLCGKYVCSGCYNDIFNEVYDDVWIECTKCEEEKFLSEDLYCSSCYEDARKVKCDCCGDFINPDKIEMYCRACMEEALATTKKKEGDKQV